MGNGQSKAHEQQFNYELGNALKGTTAQWKDSLEGSFSVERTGELKGSASKRVDILVRVDGLPVVAIETSYDGRDACKDAESRIGEETVRGGKLITTAIAVEIPLGFRHFSRDETARELQVCESLRYAMYQYLPADKDLVRLPESGFFEGSVFNLSHLLNSAVVAKEVVDGESGEVALLVRNAAERLEEGLTGDQQAELSGVVYQRTPFKGLQTTAVLWLNALLTMQRLQKQNVPQASMLPIFCEGTLVDPCPVLDVWEKIREKNWRSIFSPAITALKWSMGWDPFATAEALGLLVRAVRSIEFMQLGPHVHIGAELFPKLSEDRKETAAFYTQPATAELLATLTIRSEDLPNKDVDLFEEYRVADLACGTGTLLRAAYQQIKTFHEWNGGDVEAVKQLHKTAMEKGLVGVDISPIATHFASSSLAAIGMGEPYGKTQIGWVEVGGKEGLTGALEYFHADGLSDLFVKKFGQSVGTEEDEGTAMQSVVVSEDSMNVVMMNPPYSRTRKGQTAFDIGGLSRQEIAGCQKRWGSLIKKESASKVAGMAASFLALARAKVKRGGRIGFVLPLTAAFADSWTVTRQMLERDFEDITAVVVSSGQSLGRDALSADTNMEEMLLTATRRELKDMHKGPSSVRCITLEKSPVRLGEAREIGRAILKAENAIWLGDGKVGSVVVFETQGDGGGWSPLGVVHSDLAIVAHKLCNGVLSPFGKMSVNLGVNMARMEEVFDVGPTHDLIGYVRNYGNRGGFEFVPVDSSRDATGSDCAMWTADSNNKRQLLVYPTHKGSPVRHDLASKMRCTAGYLFYARGMRWTAHSLLSAMTHIPAMGGNQWTSLGHVDSRVLKVAALWFNSTLGMFIHWTQGQRTHAGRSMTQIGAIRKMPCPCFADLSDDVLDFAVCAFDSLKESVLLPACQVHVDVVRDEIDQAVIDMLGLPKDTIKDIRILRRLWCEEPSVHGGNKIALKLLKEKE